MPENNHLYDQIKEAAALHLKANEDGTVTMTELFGIVGAVVEAAAHVIAALADRQDHFNDLAESCEKLFDEYIEPLDIKAVPAFLEPTVDGLIRGQIRPILTRIYEKLES